MSFIYYIQLRSLEVGSEFPSITNLRLLSGELEEDGARLRSLDVKFDLAYDGNFRIDVDAVMLLGKIANISITGAFVMFFIPRFKKKSRFSMRLYYDDLTLKNA